MQLAVPRLADWCAVDVRSPARLRRADRGSARRSRSRLRAGLGRRYPPDPNADHGVPNVIRTVARELFPKFRARFWKRGPWTTAPPHHSDSSWSAMIVPLHGRDRTFGALTFVYAESGRTYSEGDLAFAEELAHRAALVIERRRFDDERAALLEAERCAREQAEIANRAKDEFLATASHELRNPLQAILGWTRLLLQRENPPELQKPLMTIERNARAQARLIEDVLDVSRIISGKLRRSGPGQRSACHRRRGRSGATRGRCQADHPLVPRRARRRGVRRSNPASADRVEPRLQCRQVHAQGRQDFHLRRAQRVPSPSHRERFGRRCRAHAFVGHLRTVPSSRRIVDAATRWTRAGLAIVRRSSSPMAEMCAPKAGKGRGSAFMWSCRRVEPSCGPNASAGIPGGVPRLPATRVLVVDDDPDAVELVHELLTSAGAVVQTALSAMEALQRLAQFNPHVLVTDIGMPDVDGYGLIRRVRSLEPSNGGRTPAIALTAYASRDDADRCLASGFQSHLAKPVDPEQLVRVVARLAGIPPA